MRFYISNYFSLRADIASELEASSVAEQSSRNLTLPKLDWVPPIQRRRLSQFTKSALFGANNAMPDDIEIPVIFSSRHGDLHKTSGLLQGLAEQEPLSPTAFALSVHNAAPGLLSIFTNNKAAANTVSSGKSTILMAIVDAYARLKSMEDEQILVIHCDQRLPDEYAEFDEEDQIDHVISFVMSLSDESGVGVSIEMTDSEPQELRTAPIALQLDDWLNSELPAAAMFDGVRNWKAVKVSD